MWSVAVMKVQRRWVAEVAAMKLDGFGITNGCVHETLKLLHTEKLGIPFGQAPHQPSRHPAPDR